VCYLRLVVRDRASYNEYMAAYMRQKYAKRRAEAIAFLGGKCVRCGTAENLEIDHIYASTADRRMRGGKGGMWTSSEERFWAEIRKCQLLCHGHHVEKTSENREFGGGSNKIPDDSYAHGTPRMYLYKKRK